MLFISFKNLLTHFIWYLEKEKNIALELCQLIEYWITDVFKENHAENVHQKC